MSEPATVRFHLNGQEITVAAPPQTTLLGFLRDPLGLTGTKDGCSNGQCGTCTVVIDGQARLSCQAMVNDLGGARIETIEGLSYNGKLHPIQQAFIETGAVQCGFCIPGMIMSTRALLEAVPHPSREQIVAHLALNRNLCRCTGYVKIFEAIELAAKRMDGTQMASQIPTDDPTFGRPLDDGHSYRMVTGDTRFCGDFYKAGMLHGKIRWADHPHARILRVDTSKAKALKGVAAVITARDIPGKNQAGIVTRDQPAIASDRVLYIGDGIAAVFAETPEIAAQAVALIDVEYEVLPGVFSPQEAARPGAPQLHPKGNLLHQAEIVRGDVDAAFEHCAVVVESDYTTPFVEHGFLEPEAGIGHLEPDGTLVIEIGNQASFEDRTQLSEILGLPEEKIRVIQAPTGGAFGGKEDMILQQYLALGALKTGRWVKMVLSRSESLRVHVKRHPAWIHYKTGSDAEGKVLAIEMDITLDTGAYASLGFDVLENTAVFGAGPYFVPNLRLRGVAWYTNNVPAGAMRGFGVNQVTFGLEQQMDAMARALGIDPFEFRLVNALDVGLPTAADHVLEDGVVTIKQTIEEARLANDKLELPAPRPGWKLGIGVASAVKNIGYGHNVSEDAGVVVELSVLGDLSIRASQHEYGQGALMGLKKLASLEMGIPMDSIQVTTPDTATTPPTGPTTASRQTFLSGNALVMACRELKQDLFHHAAEHLDVDPTRLQIRGKQIIDPVSGKSLDLKSLGNNFYTVRKRYSAPHTDGLLPLGEASHFGQDDFRSRITHFCYAYSTQVAVVEADPETGAVKVLKLISVNDVGKILNRQAVEGQIEGGVMMGIGYALSEQFIVENGVNLTDTLEKTGLPGADMVPEITPVLLEIAHPQGPQGVKGFAEAPLLATAPAVINAIYDALGVRITALPADKSKVLAALKNGHELKVTRKPIG
jgi:aldehyde oxidoreductase